jgi:hypothetical protein
MLIGRRDRQEDIEPAAFEAKPTCQTGAEKNEVRLSSKSFSEELKDQVPDKRRCDGHDKIGFRQDIPYSPKKSLGSSLSRAFIFPHQEIRIIEEDDEAYLNKGSPNRSQLSRRHPNYWRLLRHDGEAQCFEQRGKGHERYTRRISSIYCVRDHFERAQ